MQLRGAAAGLFWEKPLLSEKAKSYRMLLYTRACFDLELGDDVEETNRLQQHANANTWISKQRKIHLTE